MSPAELEKWKARGGAAPKVIGIHGPIVIGHEAMRPHELAFKTKAGASCAGCAFASQNAEVCSAALEQAALRSMKSCEDGFIYLLVEKDSRQMDLTGE